MPKVSVIVPIYGVEKYIERCAITLFEQTLDDIEYIFVNDCTQDRSMDILADVISRYPHRQGQIKIVNMATNSGQAAVRECGITQATGEYIIHCDSDDWVDVTIYEKLYNEAQRNDCDIVVCDYNIVSTRKTRHLCQNIPASQSDFIKGLLNEEVHGAVWNKLVKASLYKEIKYFPKHNLLEDMAIVVQLMAHSRKHYHLKEALYYYRKNPTSMTNNRDTQALINRSWHALENYKLICAFMHDANLSEKYGAELLRLKYCIKNTLRFICLTPDGYKTWKSIFPELKMWQVFSQRMALSRKLCYLIVGWGMYPLFFRLEKLMHC